MRRDDRGVEWFLSATGRMIRRVVVRAGEEQRLAVDESAQVHCRARPDGDGVVILAAVLGEHHAGMSIYRDGRRIPLHYRVTDAQGKALAAGPMEYG